MEAVKHVRTETQTHTHMTYIYIHKRKMIDLKDIERSCIERNARLEGETVWYVRREPLSLQ